MTLLLLMLLAQASPDSLSEAAQRKAIANQPDEAETLWRQAIRLAPNHFPSLFNLGFLNFNRKRFAEAETWLGKAAGVNPSDFNTHYLLGSALAQQGKRAPALLAWRAALALQPANSKLMQIMAVEYGNGYYFQEACAIGRKAITINPSDDKIWYIAIKACEDARDPATFDLTRQAAERFPESARSNFEYAFQLQRAGRPEDSLPYLRKAMEVDTGYEEPFFYYGELLLQQDQYEAAAQALRTALRIRPDYVPACVTLAKALMGLEQYQQAVEELEACSRRSPTHPQPHLLLSQVFFRMGDEERATREKQLSMKLRRENPTMMEAPQARPFPKLAAR